MTIDVTYSDGFVAINVAESMLFRLMVFHTFLYVDNAKTYQRSLKATNYRLL